MIGIVSDAHGNVEALTLALDLLRRRGAHSIVFLGDAVGYLPGSSCLRLLSASDVMCIKGNHEMMLLDDHVPAERESVYRLEVARQELTISERRTIEGWPIRREINGQIGRLLFVHGSPDDPLHGYVYADTPLEPFSANGAAAIFMGHTHRPFIRRSAGMLFVNVGSCGLPRDDGGLGAAALFDPQSGAVEVVRFDIAVATRSALDRCGPVHDSIRRLIDRRDPVVRERVGVA